MNFKQSRELVDELESGVDEFETAASRDLMERMGSSWRVRSLTYHIFKFAQHLQVTFGKFDAR